MTIRAVVFDIGGVLEYTQPMTLDDHWEPRLNLQPGEIISRMADVWRGGSIGTVTEAEVWQRFSETFGVTDAVLDEYREEMWAEYLGTPNQELIDYFAGLRPRYQTAILSNSFVGARERESARYRFDEMCDFIIYSHEVGMSKPDPRIYEMTCSQLGRPPGEVVFLDDREGAIEGARAIGMKGVVFKDNVQAIAELEALLHEV